MNAYDGSYLISEYTNNQTSMYNDYSVAFIDLNDYLILNVSIPTKGIFMIEMEMRIYSDDYNISNYSAQEKMEKENISSMVLYDSTNVPISNNSVNGTLLNKKLMNITNNFNMTDYNLFNTFQITYVIINSGEYHVKIKPSQYFSSRDIIEIESIFIKRQTTNPTNPDEDNDGLGDGFFSTYMDTLYNIGELTFGSSSILLDSDFDGINDGVEIQVNDLDNLSTFTHPRNPDTDSDGLLDGNNFSVNKITEWFKYSYLINLGILYTSTDNITYIFGGENYYSTNPIDPDSDNDGLSDGPNRIVNYFDSSFTSLHSANITGIPNSIQLERTPLILSDSPTGGWTRAVDAYQSYIGTSYYDLYLFYGEIHAGTNNTNNDSDNDGLLDGWEVRYQLNNEYDDSGLDPDGDTRTNLQEYTNYLPTNFSEVWWYGTNPKMEDSDNDGLNDGQEYLNGTNPLNYDTDKDDLPDGWEVYYNFSPLDDGNAVITIATNGTYEYNSTYSNVNNGSMSDTDYDSLSNLAEYRYNISNNWSEEYILFDWMTPKDNVTRPIADGVYWDGLNPIDPDTDDDYLLDGAFTTLNISDSNNFSVINYLFNHSIVNTLEDDNRTFFGELFYNTDPKWNDTDYDGFIDGTEAGGFNISINLFTTEWINGTIFIITSPVNNDTDQDGLLDQFELNNYNTNSFSDPTKIDTDGDGYSDYIEFTNNLSIKIRDMDFDNLPDSIEPFSFLDFDNDGKVNSNDSNSNGAGPDDGDEVYVLFRTNNDTFENGNIAIYLNSTQNILNCNLSKFDYNTTIGNLSNINMTPVSYGDTIIKTYDGRTVFKDNSSNIIYIPISNFTLSEYILNESNEIDNSISLNSTYSLVFRETYDWTNYLGNDSDGDGISNFIEGYGENKGYNVSIANPPSWKEFNLVGYYYNDSKPPGEKWQYGEYKHYQFGIWNSTIYNITTSEIHPDSDKDGLVDGYNILMYKNNSKLDNWTSNFNYTIIFENYTNNEYYYSFYGELDLGTRPDEIDTDSDGLLDGFNLLIHENDDRYTDFNNNGICYKQVNAENRLYYGELSFKSNPLWNNSDGRPIGNYYNYRTSSKLISFYKTVYDNISDGEEVVAGEDGYITNPVSIDSDKDWLTDSEEVEKYNTDPSDSDTDDDTISDNREVKGWYVHYVKKDKSREIRKITSDPTKLYTIGDITNNLNDSIKKQYGGDPNKFDSDGDGINDIDEKYLDNNTLLFTYDFHGPTLNSVKFDISKWDLYIKLKFKVSDPSGIYSAKLSIKANKDTIIGSASYSKIKTVMYGGQETEVTDTIKIGLSRGDVILSGVLDWVITLQIWDDNGNIIEYQVKKKSALTKLEDIAVSAFNFIYDAASKAYEMIKEALNWVFNHIIKPTLQWIFNNILSPFFQLMEMHIMGIVDEYKDFITSINNWEGGDKSIVSEAATSFLLSFFGLQEHSSNVMKYINKIKSFIEKIGSYLEKYSWIFDLKKLFKLLFSILPDDISDKVTMVEKKINGAMDQVVNAVLDKTIGPDDSVLTWLLGRSSGSRSYECGYIPGSTQPMSMTPKLENLIGLTDPSSDSLPGRTEYWTNEECNLFRNDRGPEDGNGEVSAAETSLIFYFLMTTGLELFKFAGVKYTTEYIGSIGDGEFPNIGYTQNNLDKQIKLRAAKGSLTATLMELLSAISVGFILMESSIKTLFKDNPYANSIISTSKISGVFITGFSALYTRKHFEGLFNQPYYQLAKGIEILIDFYGLLDEFDKIPSI